MNIKVKAALEVSVAILLIVAVATVVQYILALAVTTYGISAVLNGIAFVCVSTAAYVCVSLLYDIRVTQLKYKQKLTEMTKK